jgi:hypothetical protein
MHDCYFLRYKEEWEIKAVFYGVELVTLSRRITRYNNSGLFPKQFQRSRVAV